MEALSLFLAALPPILVAVDPIAAAPAFASLTSRLPPSEVRAAARRASLVGAGLLTGFALFGAMLFQLIGIGPGAFRAAGGLLLLLTAVDLLRGKRSSCRCTTAELRDRQPPADDVAVVPVATPLLAGPGAMATVTMLTSEHAGWPGIAAVVAAVVVTFAVSWLVLRAASRLTGALRPSGVALIERIMGLVLAAVALQFVVDGAKALLR
jgi:multiple antibiotic resistance protein